MRSKQEMMELILNVAKEDSRIRAAAMNGSRVNRNVPSDSFQDYDIVYLVSDMGSFINDPNWIDVFGDRIMMQTPENMTMFPPTLGGYYQNNKKPPGSYILVRSDQTYLFGFAWS